MAHKLPELPYAKDALAPVVSAETIEYHYGKHHQAYVTNLNNLIPGTKYEALSLDAVTGKERWETPLADVLANDYGNGPRGTPTVDGTRVYVITGSGAVAPCPKFGSSRRSSSHSTSASEATAGRTS